MKILFFMTIILASDLSAQIMYQDDDIDVQKEKMMSYFDRKQQHLQDAKDCIPKAETQKDLLGCKALLQESPEERIELKEKNRQKPSWRTY
jgi:hypothetical protein